MCGGGFDCVCDGMCPFSDAGGYLKAPSAAAASEASVWHARFEREGRVARGAVYRVASEEGAHVRSTTQHIYIYTPTYIIYHSG